MDRTIGVFAMCDAAGSLRRQQYRFDNAEPDQLGTYVPHGERHRAAFEDRYGFPTDIDKVWADREAHQRGQ